MKFSKGGVIIVILIMLIPVGYWLFNGIINKQQEERPLEKFYEVPFFKLINQNGDTVTSDDLKGYIYVTSFFFSNCSGVCPKLSNHLQDIQQQFKDKPQVKLISITVDPLRDSLPVLRAYADRFKADVNKWYFLTGVKDSIYALAEKGFKVPVVENIDGEEEFTHTDRMVLVDGAGFIRGYFNVVQDPSMIDSLARSIDRVLIEKPDL